MIKYTKKMALEVENFNGYIMFPVDEEHPARKYPVLYLIHGLGGIEEYFTSYQGDIYHMINEWVNSSSENVPMILVFPEIPDCGNAGSYNTFHMADFVSSVRECYQDSMLCSADCTGIAGYSVGGAAALYHAIQDCKDNKNMFGHVGAFSPSSVLYNKNPDMHMSWLDSAEDFKLSCDDPDLVRFMGCGTSECGIRSATQIYYDAFSSNGVIFNDGKGLILVNGGGHDFRTFNALLKEFLEKNIFGAIDLSGCE